jgi:Pyruvate/2-oxoacid:ferredoxin oxidoreductase delta subunit
VEKKELIQQVIVKYSSQSGHALTESKYLPVIFDRIASVEDLKILSSLPNTPKAAAAQLDMSEAEVAGALHDLHMRGFIWMEEVTSAGPRYVFADIGIFMDSVLFDPRYDRYGDEFYDVWQKYWNEEHAHLYQEDDTFRVLPVEEVIRGTKILPYESASQILSAARRIAVQRCACRVRERRCDNPRETCISMDNLADYVISRNSGREISLEEALELLKKCEDLGLVHQTVNSDTPDVICNCCSCCCSFLRSILYYGQQAASAKSRFAPKFDREKCATCEDRVCVSRCVFGGISEKGGQLHIDYQRCWGCGLCAHACPQGAIRLEAIRKADHIPRDGAKFFPYVGNSAKQNE